MGLVLDSSAAIAVERQGKNAKQLLEAIALETGDDEIAISVLTLLELAHGVTRADTPERQDKRQQFINELMSVVPIYPITEHLHYGQGELMARARQEVYASHCRIF